MTRHCEKCGRFIGKADNDFCALCRMKVQVVFTLAYRLISTYLPAPGMGMGACDFSTFVMPDLRPRL